MSHIKSLYLALSGKRDFGKESLVVLELFRNAEVIQGQSFQFGIVIRSMAKDAAAYTTVLIKSWFEVEIPAYFDNFVGTNQVTVRKVKHVVN